MLMMCCLTCPIAYRRYRVPPPPSPPPVGDTRISSGHKGSPRTSPNHEITRLSTIAQSPSPWRRNASSLQIGTMYLYLLLPEYGSSALHDLPRAVCQPSFEQGPKGPSNSGAVAHAETTLPTGLPKRVTLENVKPSKSAIDRQRRHYLGMLCS
jgi:hypothetical protein